jgi:hypothetical protein
MSVANPTPSLNPVAVATPAKARRPWQRPVLSVARLRDAQELNAGNLTDGDSLRS